MTDHPTIPTTDEEVLPETVAAAYRRAQEIAGACPIEAGLVLKLADNECRHGSLPTDRRVTCDCWTAFGRKRDPEPVSPERFRREVERVAPRPRRRPPVPRRERRTTRVDTTRVKTAAEIEAEVREAVEKLRHDTARLETVLRALAPE